MCGTFKAHTGERNKALIQQLIRVKSFRHWFLFRTIEMTSFVLLEMVRSRVDIDVPLTTTLLKKQKLHSNAEISRWLQAKKETSYNQEMHACIFKLQSISEFKRKLVTSSISFLLYWKQGVPLRWITEEAIIAIECTTQCNSKEHEKLNSFYYFDEYLISILGRSLLL